jgi:hypothetical protein
MSWGEWGSVPAMASWSTALASCIVMPRPGRGHEMSLFYVRISRLNGGGRREIGNRGA